MFDSSLAVIGPGISAAPQVTTSASQTLVVAVNTLDDVCFPTDTVCDAGGIMRPWATFDRTHDISAMPNPYSHALVLAYYEKQGWIGSDGPPRSTSHHFPPNSARETSSEPAMQRHPFPPSRPKSRLNIHASTPSLESVPRRAGPSHRPPVPTAASRPPTDTSSPISNAALSRTSDTTQPPEAHSRQNSDHATIASFCSSSSTSKPAPSIVTQVYAPRCPSSLPRVLTHGNPSHPSSLVSSDPEVSVTATYNTPTPELRAEPPEALDHSYRPPPTARMSSPSSVVSSIVTADEPSLDITCLDVLPLSQSVQYQEYLNRSRRTCLPVFVPSNSTTPTRCSRPETGTLPSTGKHHPWKIIQRPSISSQALSLESDSDFDDNSELYFGSADEHSDHSSCSPVSSPTSVESTKAVTGAPSTSALSPALPILIPGRISRIGPTSLEGSLHTRSFPQASVRGFSVDDAAPPPIARTRRVNFVSPKPLKSVLRQRPSVTHRLGSFKSTFSLKLPFTSGLRPISTQRPGARLSSLEAASVGSVTQGMMTEKARRKLEKRARKELMAYSVPYERAERAKSPIMTSNARNLMPVGRGWTWGSYGAE